MIKFFIFIIAISVVFSCNNSNSLPGHEAHMNNSSIPKTFSDSLYKAVMEGHDAGMAKMGEIIRYQKLISQKIDSVGGLKLKKPALQPALDSTLQGLKYAEELMNSWMRDFDPDKAGNSEAEKVSFYTREKEKIDTVNTHIFKSIDNAKRQVE